MDGEHWLRSSILGALLSLHALENLREGLELVSKGAVYVRYLLIGIGRLVLIQ